MIEYGDRAKLLGEYIIKTGSTVRKTASVFSLGKSTVHKEVTETLAHVSPYLFLRVRDVLDKNKRERHIRGGIATKEKYLNMK